MLKLVLKGKNWKALGKSSHSSACASGAVAFLVTTLSLEELKESFERR